MIVVRSFAAAVALAVVTVAAMAWNARAALVEIAGGVLLVAAAASVDQVAGLTVAGLWLSAQAYGMRRSGRSS